MTIGLVTPYFPDEQTKDSGIANHCLLLANGLAAMGHKIVVLHVRPLYKNESPGNIEQELGGGVILITCKAKASGIVTRIFKGKWAILDFAAKISCMLLTKTALRAAIKKHGIQVVETSSYFSLCYFFKSNKVPVAVRVSTTFSQIMSEHYPFKSRVMDIIAKMELAFIKRSKHLITHAQNHALELKQLFGINHSRFQIIPHGIKLPAATQPVLEKKNALQILFVGRMEYRKGIDVLLIAIPLVLKNNPGIKFILIGDDTDNGYQKRFFTGDGAGLEQQVTFAGKVGEAQLQTAYHNCDIFVAPSRYESFGLIYIEAMSYGKPVIGCNVGGVPEIISDNYNGLFALPGDPQSLANKLLLLAEDKNIRQQLGQNALSTVKEKFTVESLAANSANYYQQLIRN